MQSFFKTKQIVVDSVTLTIKELSAKDHIELLGKNKVELASMLCSRTVVEWAGETVESIEASVPARIMLSIVAEVFELSGIDDAKNSEPAPSDGSSTG